MEVIAMLDHDYKEVFYYQYCKTCKYKDVDDVKDPCNECLDEPYNLNSHKPVKYESMKGVKNEKPEDTETDEGAASGDN